MVRTFQTATFSSSPYFFDRGPHGIAQPISERIHPHSRPIVSYYAPIGVGGHHYGERHPMKPHRLTLTNALVMGYGLDKQIHHIYDPRPATQEELEVYHDHDYVDFLSKVTPGNQIELRHLVDTFNCVEDCPVFADMFNFCRMYAGASLAGARKLVTGKTDIAINWSGGLHHAKRGEASGFCYVNDIVLAILELLRYHPRVLYIDIDIHHGDGVELAFYHSNRVMTLSFHKYTGDFFPGTGKLEDNGSGLGKHFCLNVPLQDGIDDNMYLSVFKTVVDDAVTAFRPSSIVLQCGADSLGCDRLGAFNLSIAAHGECVNFVRKYNVPLLVLGGGGYTIKNVSRCWTYETAVLVGATIPDELPATVYDSFFADSRWKLHPPLTGKVDNHNSPTSLQRIITSIRNKLRYLQGAPSIAMQEIPPDLEGLLEEEERNPEEKFEEEMGTAGAGEHRLDDASYYLAAWNEFFDGDHDRDRNDLVHWSLKNLTANSSGPNARGRSRRQQPGTNSRRSRGGNSGGGRPRNKKGVVATTTTSASVAREDKEDEREDTRASSSLRARGKRPRRGRPPKTSKVSGNKENSDPVAVSITVASLNLELDAEAGTEDNLAGAS